MCLSPFHPYLTRLNILILSDWNRRQNIINAQYGKGFLFTVIHTITVSSTPLSHILHKVHPHTCPRQLGQGRLPRARESFYSGFHTLGAWLQAERVANLENTIQLSVGLSPLHPSVMAGSSGKWTWGYSWRMQMHPIAAHNAVSEIRDPWTLSKGDLTLLVASAVNIGASWVSQSSRLGFKTKTPLGTSVTQQGRAMAVEATTSREEESATSFFGQLFIYIESLPHVHFHLYFTANALTWYDM